MNLSAADLKHVFKKLAPVKSEVYQIGDHGVSAQDPDVLVVVGSPLTGLGTFSVSKKITQVINRMSGQIEVTRGPKSVVLKSAKARVELEAQDIKPIKLPPPADFWVSPLSVDKFKKSLSVATASASPKKSINGGGVVKLQSLPFLLGEDQPRGYRIIGTDLTVMSISTEDWLVPKEFDVLLNLAAASVVQLMDGETLEFGETNSGLQLRGGNVTVYASKPFQQFPNFDVLLAKNPHTLIEFSPQAWLEALSTVEPLIDDSIDEGAVSLHFQGSVVEFSNVGVTSRATDEAEYEQLLPDSVFDPKEFKIRLKAHYLSEFLKKAGDKATFGVTDGPIKLTSGSTTVVTMAMKEKK